jgi:predicted nucleotidyltransferase
MEKLNLTQDQITTLCKMHHVEHLYLFGSAITDDFTKKSDIDFLVKFLPIDLFEYFNNYLSLKENLKKILGREIDLVEEQSLKNPILIQNINKNKLQIYG